MDSRQTRFSEERRSGGSMARKAGWWTGIAGGGALAVVGLTRRSWPGVALAAAGGLMVAGGVKQLRNRRPKAIHVERSFLIDRPVDEVYSFWRNFENLPKFMRHLKSVTVKGDKESTWVARAPIAGSITWDAETVDEQPGDFIVWRSKECAMVPNDGSVLFERASDYHGGTKITVVLNY